MAGLRYLRNVVTLELSVDHCTGCSLCITVCPHGVFVIKEKKARIADRDACMECGACAQNCPSSAISVRADVGCASKFIYGQKHGPVMRYFFKIWGYEV